MRAAEQPVAIPANRCWCFDTVTGGDAERPMRDWAGKKRRDPELCARPQGGFCDTTYFYKAL